MEAARKSGKSIRLAKYAVSGLEPRIMSPEPLTLSPELKFWQGYPVYMLRLGKGDGALATTAPEVSNHKTLNPKPYTLNPKP